MIEADLKDQGMVSIMQPYIFPYIGYFHLISSSNIIVFYDDVTYIKQGWINRNRILVNNDYFTFTIPLKQQSSNQLIKDTLVDKRGYLRWKNKFLKTLELSYLKAPFFTGVYSMVKSALEHNHESISEIAINSIKLVYDYVELPLNFVRSSTFSPESIELGRVDRIVKITKDMGFDKYINSVGGAELYDKEDFKQRGITLQFVKSILSEYQQFQPKHISCLSIIDVLMFNSKEDIAKKFTEFQIV